jgi:hypothetical protein
MAQVLLLKIGSTGIDTEHSSSGDDVTFLSYTVTGGGPVLNGTTLDMNHKTITDSANISWTDPSTDGIVQTAGNLAGDNIMAKERSNVMTTAADILFPVVTDTAGQLDALRLPAIAGTPAASPTASGEGFVVWDSSNNILYIWDGAAWNSSFVSATTASNIQKSYVAASGGVTIRDCVTKNGNANEVAPGDANAESTSRVVGFAVATVSAAAAVGVQSEGLLSGFTGLTVGARYFLSETAGAITATAPTTSAANVVQVGFAKSTTVLDIQISPIAIRA